MAYREETRLVNGQMFRLTTWDVYDNDRKRTIWFGAGSVEGYNHTLNNASRGSFGPCLSAIELDQKAGEWIQAWRN